VRSFLASLAVSFLLLGLFATADVPGAQAADHEVEVCTPNSTTGDGPGAENLPANPIAVRLCQPLPEAGRATGSRSKPALWAHLLPELSGSAVRGEAEIGELQAGIQCVEMELARWNGFSQIRTL
jgi:hypothetical protein